MWTYCSLDCRDVARAKVMHTLTETHGIGEEAIEAIVAAMDDF
jgi:hypothetical protein